MNTNLSRLRPIRPLGALLAMVSLAMYPLLHAQNTHVWTGSVNGDWFETSNWSGDDAPPGTANNDIARFDTASAHAAVSLDAAATIGKLEFLSGAGSYTLSGAALTIRRASGTFIEHTAGNEQTIASALVLTGTSTSANTRSIIVGPAGTLRLTGGLSLVSDGATDTNLGVSGGGTLDMGTGISGINTLTASGSGTVFNYRGGTVNRLKAVSGGLINLYSITYGSLDLTGADSEIWIRFPGSAGGANSFDVRTSTGNTVTFGADIVGGGTGTYSRAINLHRDGTASNATVRFETKAGNTLALSGSIVDYNNNAVGVGTVVEIAGEGKVRFSGSTANTSQTPIVIASGATLELGKSGGALAIADRSAITVKGMGGSAGTLLLGGNDQIGDATTLTLDGGVFNAATFNETLGSLTVSGAGGTIEFAEGSESTITFSSLASIAGTLVIAGWNETASIVFTDGSAWNDTTLSRVNFVGFGAAQFDSATGRLTAAAIPEPATTGALLGGSAVLGLLLVRFRHRLS